MVIYYFENKYLKACNMSRLASQPYPHVVVVWDNRQLGQELCKDWALFFFSQRFSHG